MLTHVKIGKLLSNDVNTYIFYAFLISLTHPITQQQQQQQQQQKKQQQPIDIAHQQADSNTDSGNSLRREDVQDMGTRRSSRLPVPREKFQAKLSGKSHY